MNSRIRIRICGHRPCIIGDLLLLIDHVTSCDHVVNGLYDIMKGGGDGGWGVGFSHPISSPNCVDLWPVFL